MKCALHRTVTGDEKWVYYENPKRQKAWVLPWEPGPSTPKRNIHAQKVMLGIWWDQEGMVYHEWKDHSCSLLTTTDETELSIGKKAARVRQTL